MSYPVYDRLVAWFEGLDGDFITGDEVRAFIAAEKRDPERAEELAAFADVLTYNALMQRAVGWRGKRKHQARRTAEAQSTRARLVDAAANLSDGRPSGLMEQWFKIDDKGTQRSAAEMTGPDHMFVAGYYSHHSRQAGMQAAFHKAVAKKCGLRRTDEVFTAEQYEAMYRSITTAGRRTDAA